MLEIRGLEKKFGAIRAIHGVSFTVEPGEMVGIIGSSGAGKSTLLRSINFLTPPSGGTINWQGKQISSLRGAALREWQRRCGMIFQQFNLVPRLDVLTNVLLGRLSYRSTILSLLKLFPREDRARAILTLERVEMADFALQRADALSGGQQQRVAIARALVQQPELLLADEPIASLDPRSAKRVMEILRTINREDGITVLCNLHTLDTARIYCGRVIGMHAGTIVYDGSPVGLDDATVRRIYGVADDEAQFSESITSTSLFPQGVPATMALQAG